MRILLLASLLALGLPPFAATEALARGVPRAQVQRVDASTFRAMAMSSDALEIQSSQLALARSTNPRIRAFAERMVRDHSRTAQLMTGQSPGAVAPAMAPRHAAMLGQLRGLQGPAFDRAYAAMQVAAHREAVALFESYSRNPDDPRLGQLARQIRPHLRTHLRLARSLR